MYPSILLSVVSCIWTQPTPRKRLLSISSFQLLVCSPVYPSWLPSSFPLCQCEPPFSLGTSRLHGTCLLQPLYTPTFHW